MGTSLKKQFYKSDIFIRYSLLLLFLALPLSHIKAQSPIIKEYTDAISDLVGSFLDNPNHHANTIKVFSLTQDAKRNTDEIYNEILYSNHPQKNADLRLLDNIKVTLKCLDFITANIAGYSRGGIDVTDWEIAFNPMMTSLGWTWSVIHSTTDIVFYEYKKDGFKIVLAKNVRPKKEMGDYNACSFSCYTWMTYTKEYHAFIKRIVFGGDYQFVEYGDDETRYTKISKVTSKRGTDF